MQTRHGIGQIDAAEALVGEAAAVCVDHDAYGRDLVDIGPRPQSDSVHRIAAVQMAVKHAEAGACSADRLCHAQAIAGRGSTVAREQLLGRRANVRADHIQVGLEAAVGDDNGCELNLAAPSAASVSTSIPPEASFSARARIPRKSDPAAAAGFLRAAPAQRRQRIPAR